MSEIVDSLPLPKMNVVVREPWLVELCRGKDVLHLGCADTLYTDERLATLDALMHHRLSKVAKKLVGVDISRENLDKLRGRFPEWELVEGDVENLDKSSLTGKFDIVLAGEIIEHLGAPAHFLRSTLPFLKERTGRLVITTPNHFGTRRFLHLFRGREKYHPHHTCYYSYNTLKNLLAFNGYDLETALGYSSFVDPKSLFKRLFYSVIEDLPGKLFSSHSCEGLIFVAKRKT